MSILLETFKDHGINPNLASNGTSPALLLAAKRGSHKVLRVFKEHKLRNATAGHHLGRMTANFSVTEPEDGSTIAHCLLRKPIGDGLVAKYAILVNFSYRIASTAMYRFYAL